MLFFISYQSRCLYIERTLRSNFFLYFIFVQIIFGLELSILTYNIHGLSPIFAGDKPKERIPEILNKSKNFDIILMQENWIFSSEEIAQELDDYNVVTSNKSKFKNPIKCLLNPNGSGLSAGIKDSILLLSLDEYSFDGCSGWLFRANDCLSTKGFQHISVKINGERVDIYNTHLDAGKTKKDIRVRSKQLQDLRDYIQSNSSSYPLIIAGDMNINLLDSESREIINSFISDLNLQMVDWSAETLEKTAVLDYLFYRGSDIMEILLVKGGVNQELLGTSDHPPIEGLFDIRKK